MYFYFFLIGSFLLVLHLHIYKNLVQNSTISNDIQNSLFTNTNFIQKHYGLPVIWCTTNALYAEDEINSNKETKLHLVKKRGKITFS